VEDFPICHPAISRQASGHLRRKREALTLANHRAEDIGFDRLVVEYLHLEAWAHEAGFTIRLHEEVEEPNRRWTEVRHEAPEPYTADSRKDATRVDDPLEGSPE
jgi:hypothetical protein